MLSRPNRDSCSWNIQLQADTKIGEKMETITKLYWDKPQAGGSFVTQTWSNNDHLIELVGGCMFLVREKHDSEPGKLIPACQCYADTTNTVGEAAVEAVERAS